MSPNFNPKAVGDQIAGHLAAADKAKETHDTETRSAAALLLDVAQNHPKQMKAVCKHAGLGDSRTDELLAIAGGRKTVEQTRAATAERQRRFKAKAKKLPPPKPVTTPPVTGSDGAAGNAADAETTAEAMKAAHAEAEAQADAQAHTEAPPTQPETTEPEPTKPAATSKKSRSTAKPKPPVDASKKALVELRIAIDTWVPKITSSDDRQAAVNYLNNAILLMDAKTVNAA